MHSLALVCLERGYQVGGSDRCDSPILGMLESKGIKIVRGHRSESVEGYGLVVYTAAIHPDNPEYMRATELGLPMITRAELLGWVVSKYKKSFGIAGTHGKSSTTAMTGLCLMDAGLCPTVFNGADTPDIGGAYFCGGNDFVCFEACEYTDSFLSFYPTHAVVINAEYDHPDYFKTPKDYFSSFRKYLSQSPCAIVCKDFPEYEAVTEGYEGELFTVSLHDSTANVYASELKSQYGRYSFDIMVNGAFYAHASLSVPGLHSVSNALVAAAISYTCGAAGEDVARALSRFRGAARRFQLAGHCCGAEVYDDYAHHPTEIQTSVHTARLCTKGKLYVVYQPHTYTRTAELYNGFISSFGECDCVIFADIYPARETDTLNMSAEKLARDTDNGIYVGDFAKIADYLKSTLKEGDVCVIMGAGDVIKITPTLIG